MSLSKADILGMNDVVVASVKAWGGEVFVRSLKGWERDRFDQFVSNAREKKDFAHWRANLVSLCLCDESGKSMGFTEEEVEALSQKSACELDRVFDKCRELSGMTFKDVEDVEKN